MISRSSLAVASPRPRLESPGKCVRAALHNEGGISKTLPTSSKDGFKAVIEREFEDGYAIF